MQRQCSAVADRSKLEVTLGKVRALAQLIVLGVMQR